MLISVISLITEIIEMTNLPPLIQNFVLHFGEMGSRWGISRTVGQIYALLYVSDRPLNAEEIADSLKFSRSNVSMGLKELDGWRLIQMKHLPGDRREYYTVPEDIWDILRTLVEERRKREVEPTLTMLRALLMEKPDSEVEQYAQARLQPMHDMIEMLTQWYEEIQQLETERLKNLLKLGSRIYKLYEMKNNLRLIPTSNKSKRQSKTAKVN